MSNVLPSSSGKPPPAPLRPTQPGASGRPLSVTLASGLYVAAGIVGFCYHVTKFQGFDPFPFTLGWVLLLRIAAVGGGVYVFRGRNWARWLVTAWMAYHFLLSAFHSASQAALHAAVLALTGWLLFRPAAAEFFRRARPDGA